jgi:Tetratricopeptide repeat
LTEGQFHSYYMTLSAGQYVKLVVDQRGINAVVKLHGPDGNLITGSDFEKMAQGQETVEWVAEEMGRYRLDVAVKQKNGAAGRYEIRALELRRATENDRALREARKLNTELLRLYRAGKYKVEQFYQRAPAIRGRSLGPDRPEVAATLSNLARLYYRRGDYAKECQINL